MHYQRVHPRPLHVVRIAQGGPATANSERRRDQRRRSCARPRKVEERECADLKAKQEAVSLGTVLGFIDPTAEWEVQIEAARDGFVPAQLHRQSRHPRDW